MIAWLTDTLLYTGALIALVLVLRRPVAHHFGPQISYALWALPLLRFVMPPVVLPASFAPESASETIAIATITMTSGAVPVAPVGAEIPAEAVAPLGSVMPTPAYEPSFWEVWGNLILGTALSLWLAGAVVFLLWRAWTYFRMREWLLDDARPVGEAGSIRLVETAAVSSPVAFGVSDKVVALPLGFMASENRAARDLAIEHELAHHRGRDLLANMLAQPILALHWFNPLAWMGWRAMRRDQEAACDARVIACRDPRERAVYGHVIASFASGQRLALAAPMACPVLGDKSIIHRLKSLSMTDISPRRRLAGRALLAGAALALPFTASISYSQASAAPRAPAAPKMPRAPDAPKADYARHSSWTDDRGRNVDVKVRHTDDGKKVITITKQARDGDADGDGKKTVQTFVLTPGQVPTKEQRQALAKLRRSMSAQDWAKYNAEWSKHAQDWAKHGDEYGKQWEEWGKEWGKQWQEQSKQWEEFGEKMGQFGAAAAAQPVPAAPPAPPVAVSVQAPQYGYSYRYNYVCDENGNLVRIQTKPGASGTPARNGRCKAIADANANARRALVQARARIEHDQKMDTEVREQVLDSLDREIDRLEDSGEADG